MDYLFSSFSLISSGQWNTRNTDPTLITSISTIICIYAHLNLFFFLLFFVNSTNRDLYTTLEVRIVVAAAAGHENLVGGVVWAAATRDMSPGGPVCQLAAVICRSSVWIYEHLVWCWQADRISI